jgi:hypothetical protein
LAFGEQVLRITVCQYCSLKAYIDPVSWNMTVCGADGGMRSLDLTIEIASRGEADRILCSPQRLSYERLRQGFLQPSFGKGQTTLLQK